MKSWYFYQDRGKTVGPINEDDVKSRIRESRIGLFDFVYREGDNDWKMALEFANFRPEFGTSASALKERPWVCLQKKSEAIRDFVTTGPFSQQEVKSALLSGKIAYSDYAWKDGFSEWKRIGVLEEFNPRVRTPSAPIPQVPTTTAAELLKNVVEFKPPRTPQPEPPPAETDGRDLTKGQLEATPPPLASKSRKQKKSEVEAPPASPIPEPIAEGQPPPATKRGRHWVDFSLVGVMILLLAGTVLILSRFLDLRGSRLKIPPVERVAEAPIPTGAKDAAALPEVPGFEGLGDPTAEYAPEETEEAPAQPEPAPAPEPAPPPPLPAAKAVPKKTPTELSVTVQGGSKARIDIRTNGSPDFPVLVQVIGLPGQVSDGPSFYRLLRLTPSGDPRKSLDLSDLKLPQGKFILRAETDELKKETRFNSGTADSKYKQTVNRQRKMHAYAIWKDRLALFRLSQNVEKALTQAVNSKSFSSKGLGQLEAVNRSNGGKYVLFEDWSELKQIVKDAKDAKGGPTPAVLERARAMRERLASFSVWK